MNEQELIKMQREIRQSYYDHFITYKHAVETAHKYSPADTFYTDLTLAGLRDEYITRWKIRLTWIVVVLLLSIAWFFILSTSVNYGK